MSSEHIKVHIENALDLIEMISDDVEDNFIGTQVDGAVAVKARATMTVSTLAILSSYLRQVCEEVGAA